MKDARSSKHLLSARALTFSLLVALCASPSAFADGVPREAAQPPSAIDLATTRLAETVVALDNKIRSCKESRAVISPNTLTRLGASADDLRLAISYFSMKADNRCIDKEARDFMVAVYIRRHASQNAEPNSNNAELEALVLDSKLRELEYEARFLTLPHAMRKKFRAVKALQRPFDPIATARSLGLL